MTNETDKRMEALGFELVDKDQPGVYRSRPEQAAKVMALFEEESRRSRWSRLQVAEANLKKAIPRCDFSPLDHEEDKFGFKASQFRDDG